MGLAEQNIFGQTRTNRGKYASSATEYWQGEAIKEKQISKGSALLKRRWADRKKELGETTVNKANKLAVKLFVQGGGDVFYKDRGLYKKNSSNINYTREDIATKLDYFNKWNMLVTNEHEIRQNTESGSPMLVVLEQLSLRIEEAKDFYGRLLDNESQKELSLGKSIKAHVKKIVRTKTRNVRLGLTDPFREAALSDSMSGILLRYGLGKLTNKENKGFIAKNTLKLFGINTVDTNNIKLPKNIPNKESNTQNYSKPDKSTFPTNITLGNPNVKLPESKQSGILNKGNSVESSANNISQFMEDNSTINGSIQQSTSEIGSMLLGNPETTPNKVEIPSSPDSTEPNSSTPSAKSIKENQIEAKNQEQANNQKIESILTSIQQSTETITESLVTGKYKGKKFKWLKGLGKGSKGLLGDLWDTAKDAFSDVDLPDRDGKTKKGRKNSKTRNRKNAIRKAKNRGKGGIRNLFNKSPKVNTPKINSMKLSSNKVPDTRISPKKSTPSLNKPSLNNKVDIPNKSTTLETPNKTLKTSAEDLTRSSKELKPNSLEPSFDSAKNPVKGEVPKVKADLPTTRGNTRVVRPGLPKRNGALLSSTLGKESLNVADSIPVKGVEAVATKPATNVAKEAVESAGKATVESVGKTTGKVAVESAGKAAVHATSKTVAKELGKTGAKAVGKSLLKKIPGISVVAGAGFAYDRYKDGDYLGALGEVTSGLVGCVPVFGTAASIAIDGAMLARDVATSMEENNTEYTDLIEEQKDIDSESVDYMALSNQVKNVYKDFNDNKNIFGVQKDTPKQLTDAQYNTLMQSGVGSYVQKFESGTKGSKAIGYDKVGGTSYGRYQLSSAAGGSMPNFLKNMENATGEDAEEAKAIAKRMRESGALNTGSTKGAAVDQWQKEVEKNPEIMEKFQKVTMMKDNYLPMISSKKVPEQVKRWIEDSPVVQESMFSMAVQHGPGRGAGIIEKVYQDGMSKEDFLSAIYAERATRFKSSTPEIQQSAKNRMVEENEGIQSLLKQENESRASNGGVLPVNVVTGTANVMGDTTNSTVTASKGDTAVDLSPTAQTSGASADTSGLAKQGGVDVEGLNPNMKANLVAMNNEYKQKTGSSFLLTSGYRSIEKQKELYAKYGSPRAAKPGSSMHNFGVAVDINSPDANNLAKLGLLKKYNFRRTVPSEAWHVEAAGIDRAAVRQAGAATVESAEATKENSTVVANNVESETTNSDRTEDAKAEGTTVTASVVPVSVPTGQVTQEPSLGADAIQPQTSGSSTQTSSSNSKTSTNVNNTPTIESKPVVSKGNPTYSPNITVKKPTETASAPLYINDPAVQAFRIDPLRKI